MAKILCSHCRSNEKLICSKWSNKYCLISNASSLLSYPPREVSINHKSKVKEEGSSRRNITRNKSDYLSTVIILMRKVRSKVVLVFFWKSLLEDCWRHAACNNLFSMLHSCILQGRFILPWILETQNSNVVLICLCC